MRTFAVVNQKGGCGKTSTAINLSAVFAHRGLRTLLVDMDPQSHCALGLGVPEQGIDLSVGEALLKAHVEGFDPAGVVWEVGGNFDLLPSTMRLAGLEAPGGGLHELPDRDRRLARLLQRLEGRYDRCIIDCPPTVGLLTFNALRAVREALIPVETGFFALRGADKQWNTIRQLIERIGRPIACHLVPALYDAESSLATDILAALRRQYAGQVIPVVLHDDEVVREAASFGQPVIEYAPQSQARQDFESLADWLEDHPPHPGLQIEVMRTPIPEKGLTMARSHALDPAAGAPSQDRAAELAERVRNLRSTLDRDPDAYRPPQPEPGPHADIERPYEPETLPAESPAGVATVEAVYGAVSTGGGVRFAQPGDGRLVIAVAGDFNDWSPTATPLPFDANLGVHHALVEIPPGRYRYRLVVDGRWKADPYNAHKQVNEYEELNSVLVVPGPPDKP